MAATCIPVSTTPLTITKSLLTIPPEPTAIPSAPVITEFPIHVRDHPLIPPCDPRTARYNGPRARDSKRSVCFDEPSSPLIFHLIWDFLEPHDRLQLTLASPVMDHYSRLRVKAAAIDLSPLLLPRPAPDESPIDQTRVRLLACAFLRFNCDYGDMIRWLGGPYTGAHRDWEATFKEINEIRDCPPPHSFPVPDYERAYRACTEGVPLKANYTSHLESCRQRNNTAPSANVTENQADVDETLRKEEKLSYHVILPRFLWRFFSGLLLAVFRVAYRYGDPKPRLCVDPSTKLTDSDQGNVNAQCPAPGVIEDENPTIHYGTAFMRYLTWLWNLRISFPDEEIIQSTDDISAAFHRVLYHPDMGPAFATVWRSYLVIPVSAIFGWRCSPGKYMWYGELRSHFANVMKVPPHALDEALIQRIQLPDPPPPEIISALAQATPDKLNTGIALLPDGTLERRQPVFVDDVAIAHIRKYFLESSAASVYAAYVLFGHPDDDPTRPPCINPHKWKEVVTHVLLFLGYEINTRTMSVSWPVAKREKLRVFLDTLLEEAQHPRGTTPHIISRVLGLIRHAAPVAHMGTFRSLRLQFIFNDLASTAPRDHKVRRWYQRRQVKIPPSVIEELRSLRTLITNDPGDPAWTRPIGLMVPRDATITVFTDASTHALGGWSREGELNHMWRITVDDLVAAGAPSRMQWNNAHNYHEPTIDPKGFHINILEFFAIFIEIWVIVRQLFHAHQQRQQSPEAPAEAFPDGGHRILVRADNTSALSWLRYATRTKRAPVRRIARLLTAFLCHPFITSFLNFQGKHIAGVVNVSADHLSRFKKSASWAAVMRNCPNLTNLRTCQLPLELLSILVSAYISEQTEEWFATATTRLWTIASPAFATGSARPQGTSTSVAPA